MIRRRADLTEGDDEDATRAAVTAMVEEHVADEPSAPGSSPGSSSCSGSAKRRSAAGRSCSPRGGRSSNGLAATGTVAFVVEDLQWADDGLLDFLEHLLDWGRSSPIFVVTLARPELLERRPGWGTDRRGAVSMRLDPLTDAAMRELLAGIAPDLPAPVVDPDPRARRRPPAVCGRDHPDARRERPPRPSRTGAC